MLINKLIFNIFTSPLRYKSLYFLAAEKTQKAKQPAPTSTQAKENKPKKQNKPNEAPEAKQKQAANTQKNETQATSISVNPFSNLSQASTFYRNAIQKVHVKKSTGRGKFTEQALMHMVSIAHIKDINLLFEAYYNFLGHFTPISNKTVDAFLTKVISLASRRQQLIEPTYKKVMEVIKNHEYLSYYPHYQTTLRVAEFAVKANQFSTFLDALNMKILIKLDSKAIQSLYQLATEWKDFIKLTRLLTFRFNRGLLVNTSKEEILEKVLVGIKRKENITPTKQSQEYQIFLHNFDQSDPNLALAWKIMVNPHKKAQQTTQSAEQSEK